MRIGYIVRGKFSEDHAPGIFEQHSDVLLSDGSPMGYFGEGGFSPNIGMFMNGMVYDYDYFLIYRRFYVDADSARRNQVVSTVCTIEVNDLQARLFDEYWKKLAFKANGRNEKKQFSMLGDNCSTNARKAFGHAGILPYWHGIPGLDTPDHLFRELKARYGSQMQCQSGYVGVQKTQRLGFLLVVEK